MLSLNKAQAMVVDNFDGPMLVVAGPGTGKTQVISNRIANILSETDTLASSILCLTFTENGAANMRERLVSLIGKEAYDVQIFTYHAFGKEIINAYPEYFQALKLEKPIDEIASYKIVESILDKTSYSKRIKYYNGNIKDILNTISDCKKALLSADKLRDIAQENIKAAEELSPKITNELKDLERFPSSFGKAAPVFAKLHTIIAGSASEYRIAEFALAELDEATALAEEENKSSPLTKWKNKWLFKNSNNNYVFTDMKTHSLSLELADLMDSYDKKLTENGFYDFDDMILKTIKSIGENDDLRFNLQERYLYILLDEFQDTNASQFELVRLITDSPVNEGKPNVMAVGDDDQAIFAFQGAMSSNMADFRLSFTDTAVISLTENYRSTADILHFSKNVGTQIVDRLVSRHTCPNGSKARFSSSESPASESLVPMSTTTHVSELSATTASASSGRCGKCGGTLADVDKVLKSNSNTVTNIERVESGSETQELAWVADKIASLVAKGVKADDITVLAPQHKYLERLVPFLQEKNVDIAYEKRENILTTPINIHIREACELLLALNIGKNIEAHRLMPRVLSHPSFGIPAVTIWQTNWASRIEKVSWVEAALEQTELKPFVEFFLELSQVLHLQTLEQILDIILGSTKFKDTTLDLKSWITKQDDAGFYDTLQHLGVIRKKLRSTQEYSEDILTVADFIQLHQDYADTNSRLINSHAVRSSENAVTLQTVYKAKGLEYEHVFIINTHDNVWGTKKRSNFNKFTLPVNLQHIRKQSNNEDDLLRLFFVAITRAKSGLYLSSHLVDDLGKPNPRLKFMDEQEQTDKSVIANALPDDFANIKTIETDANKLDKNLELSWSAHHVKLDCKMKTLLAERLENYQLNPSNLNSFIDLQYAGPQEFFLKNLLQFPQSPTASGEFGNAIHETLQYYQDKLNETSQNLAQSEVDEYFALMLNKKYILGADKELFLERGQMALRQYLDTKKETFKPKDVAEARFKHENVRIGDSELGTSAHLNGNIDKLEVDKTSKTITVVDYKTGKSYSKWQKDLKLHKYKQQLYFYKILIEGSNTYRGYKVQQGRLDFIEPDRNTGEINSLVLEFDDQELEEFKKLISAVWQKIQDLDFPDTSKYTLDLKGVLEFEKDLNFQS